MNCNRGIRCGFLRQSADAISAARLTITLVCLCHEHRDQLLGPLQMPSPGQETRDLSVLSSILTLRLTLVATLSTQTQTPINTLEEKF